MIREANFIRIDLFSIDDDFVDIVPDMCRIAPGCNHKSLLSNTEF